MYSPAAQFSNAEGVLMDRYDPHIFFSILAMIVPSYYSLQHVHLLLDLVLFRCLDISQRSLGAECAR